MRVYLSAAQAADLSVLRDVLTDLGAEIVPSVDMDATPSRFLDAWQDVDAAVLVLMPPDRTGEERVLVEAGVALGRQIPLLILAEHGVPSGLLQLAKTAEMRGILLNPEALRFHLSLFLKGLSSTFEHDGLRPRNRIPNRDVEVFRSRLEGIRQISSRTRGALYEELVVDIFRTAGAEIAAPVDRETRGFDFVVAMPDLDLGAGPLVVEVKASSSPKVLTNAALGLQYLVLQERAGLGLLLYEDADLPPTFALQIVPMVVSLGMSELLRELEREPLADVVAQARNEAVRRL